MTQIPTLIVMAAGIGSRYGGLKQVDPIGPNGEIVIDYAVFDALRAGFGKVVFLIRKDIEEIFRERVGSTIEKQVQTVYVFQELDNLPPGFSVPPERKKPWGTGHAVLSCKDAVHEPFAVINADDFYGPGAFQALADYLRQAQDQESGPYDYSMAGYDLENTLSEHGTVSRGVCEVTPDGYLAQVRERTKIKRFGDEVKYTENGEDWVTLPAHSTVSMNMWGFTPSFFKELEQIFPRFLKANVETMSKVEFYLPFVVNQLLNEQKARVKVLPVQEKWFGVTYPEDRASVQEAIRGLVRQGVYPKSLWA
jgi:NDP-sugar pyrophosphorylase family protein